MLSDEEFRQLLDFLDRPWAGFRKVRKGVKKRVRRHMERLNCSTLTGYLEKIESDPSALAACEECLRVTISRFFRDRGLWEHLGERILPEMTDRFSNGLTAWSAGCANGEEPYTLSMIWDDLAANDPSAPEMEILATDADGTCLRRAGAGRYPISSLIEVPERFKIRWFRKIPGGRQWQVDECLHLRIRWQVHDILDPPPRHVLQMVFLRNNLLTYYRGARMETVFERIVAALAPGGLLILGSHERLPEMGLSLERDVDCPWVYRVC
jgi:chemotaxis protein methyltransferase CheR